LLANQLLKRWKRKRITLLVDEAFQAIGLDKAEIYVKMLLNLIEYPPESYENIVSLLQLARACLGGESVGIGGAG